MDARKPKIPTNKSAKVTANCKEWCHSHIYLLKTTNTLQDPNTIKRRETGNEKNIPK